MDLETTLAQAGPHRVELRDPQKNYNKMTQAELQELTPDFKWADYFKEIKLTEPGDINVGQPDFFKGANEVFKSTPIDDWKDISALASGPRDRVGAFQRFREREFQLLRNNSARNANKSSRAGNEWSATTEAKSAKRSANFTSRKISRRKQKRARSRWSTICKEALADESRRWNGWTSRPSRKRLKKLAAFTVKIGYPDKWRDYSLLQDRSRTRTCSNVMRADNVRSRIAS